MFTFRLNSYQFFQYLLIFFVSRVAIAGQTPKKCAAFNEYCLNHWDCCSNSCMSYMYRCTRGHNTYPYPFLDVSYKPTVTLDQILEQNFGSSNSLPAYQPKPYFVSRFGSAEEAAATEIQIILQKSEQETVSESTTLKNPADSQKTELDNRLMEMLNGAYEKDNNIISKTTETTESTTTTTLSEKPSCLEIGEKCYKFNECCSKRCHGFLHQCVT